MSEDTPVIHPSQTKLAVEEAQRHLAWFDNAEASRFGKLEDRALVPHRLELARAAIDKAIAKFKEEESIPAPMNGGVP